MTGLVNSVITHLYGIIYILIIAYLTFQLETYKAKYAYEKQKFEEVVQKYEEYTKRIINKR